MKALSIIARLAFGALLVPWIIVVGVLRVVLAVVRFPARVALRMADTLSCPAGHLNAVHGRWTCSCGANYLGHAFGPCPICGMPAGFMRCGTCGLAIRSPWKRD